jgi:signal transduction histidine kinase
MHQLDPDNPMPGIIVEEASRLNGIITDFLNFARPHQPDLRPGRLQPVVEKTLRHLHSEFDARRIIIHKQFEPIIGDVLIDSDMLYQALLNLLINAMQAIEKDGCIDIVLAEHHSQVKLTLHDSGPGIDDGIRDKIWDPFFTYKDKGTGLGLGIVKQIIDAHDGLITITNAAPGGTLVEIFLPLYRET